MRSLGNVALLLAVLGFGAVQGCYNDDPSGPSGGPSGSSGSSGSSGG